MRFATNIITINAPFPIKQYGHLVQVLELEEYHDDLHARLLYLEDENVAWLHVSADNLQFKLNVQKEIQKQLREFLHPALHVTVSCTHAHHCCDSEEKKYCDFFIQKVVEAAKELKIQDVGELTVSYTTSFFDEVGKSRISNHEADALQVDLFQIKKEEKVLAEIIVHNVHPTILFATSSFFSSEFPGYTLRRLNEVEPDVFHTYMSGPSGDISTRFTRTCQTYNSVEYLGDKLFNKLQSMKEEKLESFPIKLSFAQEVISIDHQFQPIDLSMMPENLSDREIETIGYGQIMRERLKEHPENLIQEAVFSCINFNGPRIIFEPIEMFSYYRTEVDLNTTALVCYSNGCGPYITGPGQYLLTYETFTDTLTDETKKRLIDTLHKWGKNS